MPGLEEDSVVFDICFKNPPKLNNLGLFGAELHLICSKQKYENLGTGECSWNSGFLTAKVVKLKSFEKSVVVTTKC